MPYIEANIASASTYNILGPWPLAFGTIVQSRRLMKRIVTKRDDERREVVDY